MTGKQIKSRSISEVITSKTTLEGDGFVVHRPFPNYSTREFDPFLLLDEMGPIVLEKGEAKGASPHPHRGFETVTYVISGVMEHKDSKGHSGKLQAGDVQWMTAGSGVVHSEMPESEFKKNGGKLHGFQLWVNLPKKDKMIPPQYQEITSEKIPTAQSKDGKVKVKILAGQSMGKTAVINTRTPISYLHFIVQPGGKVIQEIPSNFNVFAYVSDGEGVFGLEKKPAGKEQAVFFKKDGDEVIIENKANSRDSLDFLLIGGVSLDEPIARYGPFVMNTEDELQQAIEDYKSGKMGKIDF